MARELKKPLRRKIYVNAPHGVTPEIVVTLYPSGVIGMREARHRREYVLGLGGVYVQAVMAAARAEAIEKKKARKAKRKGL